GIDIRRDAQAMQRDVVAGVDNHGQIGFGRGGAQPAHETRATHTAGEGDNVLDGHGQFQPTKSVLRRMNPMSASHPVWAVVVARIGHGAKSRLAGTLSTGQRRQLALAMLGDVLDVCRQARARGVLDGTLSVVDEPAARAVVELSDALAVADPGPGDMNAAVSAGVRAARLHGARTAVIVPGDVPSIEVADFASLLRA